MAYARYDRKCEWYIFWQTEGNEVYGRVGDPKTKGEEVLAIWHSDYRAEGPAFTYDEVDKMLKNGNFSRVPGFTENDRDLIVECLSEFIKDVDEEYGVA